MGSPAPTWQISLAFGTDEQEQRKGGCQGIVKGVASVANVYRVRCSFLARGGYNLPAIRLDNQTDQFYGFGSIPASRLYS
jgi:hypothetical protein